MTRYALTYFLRRSGDWLRGRKYLLFGGSLRTVYCSGVHNRCHDMRRVSNLSLKEELAHEVSVVTFCDRGRGCRVHGGASAWAFSSADSYSYGSSRIFGILSVCEASEAEGQFRLLGDSRRDRNGSRLIAPLRR